jgi:hypothetical protein
MRNARRSRSNEEGDMGEDNEIRGGQMPGEETPGYEGQVSCGYCRKNIPRSTAYQPEGEDYVAYFCGLDCFEAWRNDGTGEKD